MAATNEQVQQWSNERVRPYAEYARSLLLSSEDNNASIAEVYANLTDNPDWADAHNGNPPSLLTPSDLLAVNTFSDQLAKLLRGDLANDAAKIAACNDIAGQLPIILKSCVRPVPTV